METGLLKVDITSASMWLSPTSSVLSSVWINFFKKAQGFFYDESERTVSPTPVYSDPHVSGICLAHLSHHDFTLFHLFPLIDIHLQDPILSRNLAERISSAHQTLGFPPFNLAMSVNVVFTHQYTFVLPPPVYCLPQAQREDQQEEEEESTCAICLEDLWNDNDKDSDKNITKLPYCSHLFHQSCIDEWLVRRNSCPLCRQTVIKELDS